METNPRIASSLQRIAVERYDSRAAEFVRFRGDDNDERIAGIVRTVCAEDAHDVDDFRRNLDDDGAATIRLYAMRRTLEGRRRSSMGPLYEALDGFALLPSVEDVPWDSWLKAALFGARAVGGDVELIRRRFHDIAHEDAYNRFAIALEAMNRIDDLSQCRIAEVSTSYGTGFVEILVFRDAEMPGLRGLRGSPRLGDNQIDFRPRTNVAQLTALLADAIGGHENMVVGAISQDQLVASTFSLTTSGSYLDTTACLSFVAQRSSDSEPFTVFVAELPDDTDLDTATLAVAASATFSQAARFDASRIIVFSPQPSFDDDSDLSDSAFEAFLAVADRTLLDPSTA